MNRYRIRKSEPQNFTQILLSINLIFHFNNNLKKTKTIQFQDYLGNIDQKKKTSILIREYRPKKLWNFEGTIDISPESPFTVERVEGPGGRKLEGRGWMTEQGEGLKGEAPST